MHKNSPSSFLIFFRSWPKKKQREFDLNEKTPLRSFSQQTTNYDFMLLFVEAMQNITGLAF